MTPIKKVVSTLNYLWRFQKSQTCLMLPNWMLGDSRNHPKVCQFALSWFLWESVKSGMVSSRNSLNTITKRNYALLGEALEYLKVPFVDVALISLYSGGILSKDGDNILQDHVNRKKQSSFQKMHKAVSMAVRSSPFQFHDSNCNMGI